VKNLDGPAPFRNGSAVTLTSTSEQTADQSAPVTYRSVVVLAALVLLPAFSYVVGVLLPYYASARDGSSADGAGWLSLLGFYSLLLTPLGALVALGGCALQLLAAFPRTERRVSPGVAAGLGVVAVVCVVTLAFFLSPLGRALTNWTLD